MTSESGLHFATWKLRFSQTITVLTRLLHAADGCMPARCSSVLLLHAAAGPAACCCGWECRSRWRRCCIFLPTLADIASVGFVTAAVRRCCQLLGVACRCCCWMWLLGAALHAEGCWVLLLHRSTELQGAAGCYVSAVRGIGADTTAACCWLHAHAFYFVLLLHAAASQVLYSSYFPVTCSC